MKSYQIVITAFLLLVNFTNVAFCQDITLSWDPSPTPDVDGYKVYYKQGNMDLPFDGTGANEGVSPIDIGNTLSTILTGFDDGVTYFFTVTAYQNPDTESSYSNIVSNSWLPSLIIPANNATNEPVPVTFRWETAPSGYDVTYTLYYGTDQNEVSSAGSLVSFPPGSGNTLQPIALIFVLALCFFALKEFKLITPLKPLRSACSLLLIISLGGFLTACGGGGGGGSSSSRSVSSNETAATESVLYSVNKGSSDYHQAFDLSASTTYYWKVVATDTQDPNLNYESEVRTITTEAF